MSDAPPARPRNLRVAAAATVRRLLGTRSPDRRLIEQAEAGLLRATAQTAPLIIPTHVLIAFAVTVIFAPVAPHGYLLGLDIAILLVTLATCAGAWAHHRGIVVPCRQGGRHAGTRRDMHRRVRRGFLAVRLITLATGLAWASLPVMLAPVTGGYQLIVVGLSTGMLAYAYLCGPVRYASTLFIAPMSLGCLYGLRFLPAPFGRDIGILLALYTVVLVLYTQWLSWFCFQRELGRATVLAQNETIGLLLKDIQAEASDWLWESDEAGLLSLAPERMSAMFGLPANTTDDRTLVELLGMAGIDPAGIAPIASAMAQRVAFQDVAVRLFTPDGALRWWRLSGRPARDPLGHFAGYRGVGSDITQARRDEERIGYLASHDTLTAMPNRTSFLEALQAACDDSSTGGFALLYVDLDGFKAINDGHGHTLGDHLLAAVAQRLRGVDEATATFRLGGDEFAMIRTVTAHTQAEWLAERTLSELAQPFTIDGLCLSIGASIGIALAPDDAADPASLLHRADLALYEAKTGGKGRWARFDPAHEMRVRRRRMLDETMRAALAADQFDLHYQPIVDIPTGRITGAEALLRWHLPGEGWIAPAEIIPIAEATGFIREIGLWALIRACRDLARWPDLAIAVNISPVHFRHREFCDEVRHVLDETAIASGRLEIEVTESMLLESGPGVRGTIARLRAMGVRIVLDDFGTGYSSLSYLREFTFDKIKIDRCFVAGVDEQPAIAAVIGAIHTIAEALALSITVEGVETSEQLQALRTLSTGTVQGYYLGRPRPLDAFAALLAAKDATAGRALAALTSPAGRP